MRRMCVFAERMMTDPLENLPVHSRPAQAQWQTPDPESVKVWPAIGMNCQVYFPGVASPARAGDEFADAAYWIGVARWILWEEAFVFVVVPAHYDVGVCVIERLPECVTAGVVAMLDA
jgi:hypothetical protein